MNRTIAVLNAPSNLGLRPPRPGKLPGVAGLAAALRTQQIVARLHALDAGAINPPAYHPERDPQTGVRNLAGVRTVALDLAAHLHPLLDSGAFTLVLGGDCSILLGPMLALRQRGRAGLCFLDGHADLLTPATSATGGAAGMDLALATGRGPNEWTTFGELYPLVGEHDVVLGGYRDVEDIATYPGQAMITTAIRHYDLETIRERGVDAIAQEMVTRLSAPDLDGFWIHLDADVLDDAIMPAVDSRQPDGLSYSELIHILQILLNSGRALGMDVTIFDPELDPTGAIASAFTDALVEACMVL